MAEHWEVAGLIANAGVDAPAELWDRIAARIDDTEPHARRPAPLLLSQSSAPSPSPVVAASRCPSHRRRMAWSAMGTIAAAAAVVAVLLGVQVGRLDQRVGAVGDGQPTVRAVTGGPGGAARPERAARWT